MMKIQTLNEISSVIHEYLPPAKFQVSKELAAPDALLVRSADVHSRELNPELRAIARAGAGVNNIPIDKCSELGIVVFNTPGANANAVKELVLTALLLSSRRVVQGIEWVRTLKGQGAEVPKLVEKGKSQFVGPEVKGKTLGVIGLGAIGAMVANEAHDIGMEVMGFDPYMSIQSAWRLSRAVKQAASLDDLLAHSDYITIHVPQTEETKGYLNRLTFSKMKKGVRLLNFSRGGLVNDHDLAEALENGTVSTYVTDFPNDDLLGMENVICIPHLGASTPESEDNCAEMAAKQLHDFLINGNIVNSVNFPHCELPRSAAFRLAICHRNVPSMVGQITSLIAEKHINISDMINKSRKGIAYTLVDLDAQPGEDVLDSLHAIPDILRVTVLG